MLLFEHPQILLICTFPIVTRLILFSETNFTKKFFKSLILEFYKREKQKMSKMWINKKFKNELNSRKHR